MKRFILLILSAVLCLTLFSGCNTGDLDDETGSPQWNTGVNGYSYDAEYHWKKADQSDKKSHQNDLGMCRCGMYYETDDIVYDLRKDGNGNSYYAVSKYEKQGIDLDIHIEIPAYYNDIPVLQIDNEVFYFTSNFLPPIESIKLNEGLKSIGTRAFKCSSIKEIIIPNSVEGSLYNVFDSCKLLETVIVGNGVELIDGYCFSGCDKLKYVKLGSSVKEIQRRAFYCNYSIAHVVIPKSVISIPEDEIYASSVGRYISLFNIFEGSKRVPNIYFEITEDEYKALVIPPRERNPLTGLTIDPETGKDVPPSEFEYTTYGYTQGWCGVAPLYFVGEWRYDENGRPIPLI